MHRLETNVSSVSYLSVVFRSKEQNKNGNPDIFIKHGKSFDNFNSYLHFSYIKCFHLYCLTPSTVEVSKFETLNSNPDLRYLQYHINVVLFSYPI